MAEPKKKLSNTRSGNRKSHLALTRPVTTLCSNCKKVSAPHMVCMQCGFYKGKLVLPQKTKK